MLPKILITEADYEQALEYIETLQDPIPGSRKEEELDLFFHLIEEYEEAHYPIDLPTPIDAIKFRMEQQNLKQKDLIPYLGSQSRVSEILNGKRKLSKSMILNLHTGLGIPLEVLLGNQSKNSVSGSNELNESRKKLVYS